MMGMSRPEARRRVSEYDWDGIRQLMIDAHPRLAGEAGKVRSRLNRSMTMATAFNIMWRAVKHQTGPIKDGRELIAVNVLREFGIKEPGEVREADLSKPHHEELLEIEA